LNVPERRAIEVRLYDILPQFVSPHAAATALRARTSAVIMLSL
jgi:hypothetical protein